MPHLPKSAPLRAKIELADSLYKNITDYIQDGNEEGADSFSGQYEAALESIFSFKTETAEDRMLKLNFMRRLLSVDHSNEALLRRAFDSLEEDIAADS